MEPHNQPKVKIPCVTNHPMLSNPKFLFWKAQNRDFDSRDINSSVEHNFFLKIHYNGPLKFFVRRKPIRWAEPIRQWKHDGSIPRHGPAPRHGPVPRYGPVPRHNRRKPKPDRFRDRKPDYYPNPGSEFQQRTIQQQYPIWKRPTYRQRLPSHAKRWEFQQSIRKYERHRWFRPESI